MNNQQNCQLLHRALAQLSPPAFSHPVWVNFLETRTQIPANFSEDFLHAAIQLQAQSDWDCACQMLLLRAVAQDWSGDPGAALTGAQQVWTLAECYGLTRVSWWALWGMSALGVRQGNDQAGLEYLHRLQILLHKQDAWVLSNIISMLRETLLNQAGHDPWPAHSPGADLKLALLWLRRWGESPTRIEAACNEIICNNLNDDQASTLNASWFFSLQNWRSIWGPLEQAISRKFGPAQLDPNGSTNPLSEVETRLKMDTMPSFQVNGRDPEGYVGLLTPPGLSQNGPALPLPAALPASMVSATLTPRPPSAAILDQSAKTPGLTVYTLGAFRVYQNEQQVATWQGNKSKLIFKYLVTHRQHFIHREILMDLFWPEAAPEAARRNLYQAIYKLRQTLQADYPEFSHVLFEDNCYGFNPELEVWVDSEAFVEYYQTGQRLEQKGRLYEAIRAYELAQNLYEGEFLAEDIYEEWPAPQREHLKQTYLDILDRLSQYYCDRKQLALCITLCQKILGEDRCREDAHRRLMRCYHYQGQRHLALRQYHLCVEALAKELEVSPMPATLELYQQIRKNSLNFQATEN